MQLHSYASFNILKALADIKMLFIIATVFDPHQLTIVKSN